VKGYFRRALRAELCGGRSLFLLAVAGVALGVGSVLGIEILNAGAIGAFAGTVRAVSGEAQLTVFPRSESLPDSLLAEVLAVRGVRAALPVVKAEVALEGHPGASLDVVGTDLMAPQQLPEDVPRGELAQALSKPGWVAVSPAYAAAMGWRAGSPIAVSLGSRRLELAVGALVDFARRAPLASRSLAVMDIAQAQALFHLQGRLQEIEVSTDREDVALVRGRLEARFGEAIRVVTPGERVAEADTLLGAFRANLTALSLVSLFVGGFLVYASTQAALVRRREEFGVLRCLGATRSQVVRLVLIDSSLLGLLGTAAGIPLGWLSARENLVAVSATLRNVYLLQGVEGISLTPGLLVLAFLLGMAGALAGALLPALDLAREDPRALLSVRADPRGSGRAPLVAAVGGLLVVLLVLGLVLGPGRSWAPGGFALALALLWAAPLGAPLLLRATACGAPPRRFGVAYGTRDLAHHLRVTAAAAGALAVAVSMMGGITVMIGSFRQTVEDWLAATLRADVYVTTPSWRRGQGEATLAPSLVSRLAREPGVRAVDRLRQLSAEVGGHRISVSGFEASLPEAQGRVLLVWGNRREAFREVQQGAVLVSEPLWRKRGIGQSSGIDITGPRGTEHFEVAGVYRDYGAEAGSVLMDLGTLEAHYGKGSLTNLALYLEPGDDAEATVARLKSSFAGDALLIRSNRRLREQVLGVFEQTFAVTRLLQAMSLLVAVAGVTLALLVLARERSSEVALYRTLGATRGQVFRLFVGRALGLAASGLLLGGLGGAGLALILVHLVNPAWFGWSIALHPPWVTLIGQVLAVLGAALAASLYPALRASRTPMVELSRDAL